LSQGQTWRWDTATASQVFLLSCHSSLNACGFLAKHLDRLEAPRVVREDRVGHFSRRLGAAQPLRVELQGRSSRSETLQDERRPSRQVLFHDPSFLDMPLEAAPFDSLDLLELRASLETRLQLPLTDEKFNSASTLRDLYLLVNK